MVHAALLSVASCEIEECGELKKEDETFEIDQEGTASANLVRAFWLFT